MADPTLLQLTPAGLYCAAGDFFVDPWRPVDRAVVTHAHSDHARPGCRRYLTSKAGERVLRSRLGPLPAIEAAEYGQPFGIGPVRVSLHPAGHILGSAQIRLEHRGEVWVVSGDYATEANPTCAALEPLRCHTFITESTFGLPVYRWPPQAEAFADINGWWQTNRTAGRGSLLFVYALGKAQRVLAGIDPGLGPVYVHGAIAHVNQDYAAGRIALPAAQYVSEAHRKTDWSEALILAPTSAAGTPWVRRFGDAATAFASGWMRIRGLRRRQAVDRGFVVSDHADWPGLLATIAATGAQRVWVTHGYAAILARWLQEQGLEARPLDTQFGDDAADDAAQPSESPADPPEHHPPAPDGEQRPPTRRGRKA
jgi:putative mRNA 3-end processing factor